MAAVRLAWCLGAAQALLVLIPAALWGAPGPNAPPQAPVIVRLSNRSLDAVQFYHDRKAELSAAQAARVGSWTTSAVPLGVGYTGGALWARFDLHNDTSQQDFLIENQVAFVDRIELFVFSGSALVLTKVAGAALPPKGSYPNPLFRFSLPSGATRTVLLRYSGGASILADPVIHTAREFGIQRSHVRDLQAGYFGAVFLVVLLNVVLFLRTRNSTFAVYGAYVVAAGFYQFAYTGFARVFLFPTLGAMHNRMLVVTGTIAFLGVVVFSIRFLTLRRRSPQLFVLLAGLSALLALNALSSPFLPAHWADRTVHLLSTPTALLLLGSGLWSYWKGFRPARLYALGWCALVGGIVVFNLFALGVLDLPGARHAIQIGTFVEMVLFNLAIADRLLVVRHESDPAPVPAPKQPAAVSARLSGLDVDRKADELRRLLDEEHIYADEDLSLGRLAAMLEIRPDQLSELINSALGQSFTSLVNHCRVEAAKRLMVEQPQRSVLQIAFAVGFNTKSSFYEAFQKRVGVKPSEYRRLAIEEGAANASDRAAS